MSYLKKSRMTAVRTRSASLKSGLRAAFPALAVGMLLLAGINPVRAGELVVFAAASLKNALDDANTAYRQQGGSAIKTSYAASGPLARQIESGAPADLFISADLDWMDYAQGKALIKPETRTKLLGNRLVLVTSAKAGRKLEIGPNLRLAEQLGGGRLAIGDPQYVPAGKYAETALKKLGQWNQVWDKLAKADSVRGALALVSRGEAPFGIVYETDTAADPGVAIAGVFPADSHPPIIYPAAVTAASGNPEAAGYLTWLGSPAAASFFQKQGFQVLK
jgi:molybdate transport system substrate-binding protein